MNFFIKYRKYIREQRLLASYQSDIWTEKFEFIERIDLAKFQEMSFVDAICKMKFYKSLQLFGPIFFMPCSSRLGYKAFAGCEVGGGTLLLDKSNDHILYFDENIEQRLLVSTSQKKFEDVMCLILSYECSTSMQHFSESEFAVYMAWFKRELTEAAGDKSCFDFFDFIY
jgi:hypothetical protein